MSAAPATTAGRVRAIEAVRSDATTDGLFPDKTAEDESVAVDWGFVAILETPLCPPTVGSQPLVEPKLS
jgi:hypothetical protein